MNKTINIIGGDNSLNYALQEYLADLVTAQRSGASVTITVNELARADFVIWIDVADPDVPEPEVYDHRIVGPAGMDSSWIRAFARPVAQGWFASLGVNVELPPEEFEPSAWDDSDPDTRPAATKELPDSQL